MYTSWIVDINKMERWKYEAVLQSRVLHIQYYVHIQVVLSYWLYNGFTTPGGQFGTFNELIGEEATTNTKSHVLSTGTALCTPMIISYIN